MKRRGLAAGLVVALAAIFILGVGWPCPLQRIAGVPCPTCGVTRATRLVLQGDFAAATRMHPLVWIAVPVALLVVSLEVVGYARTGAWGASRRLPGSNIVMVGTAVLLFAVWVARFAGAFGGPVR